MQSQKRSRVKIIQLFNTKEQTVLKPIRDAFEGEDMQTQYSVLSYRIDFYFHKHKLGNEVDELGRADGNLCNELGRQKALKTVCLLELIPTKKILIFSVQ